MTQNTSAPIIYDERRWSNRWCLQAVLAGMVTKYTGKSVLPPEIDAVIPASLKGTFGTETIAADGVLSHFGIPHRMRSGSMQAALNAAQAENHELGWLHQCDGYTTPQRADSTEIAHFRTLWGQVGANIITANPWGGIVNQPVATDKLLAADLNQGFEIMVSAPVGGQTVASGFADLGSTPEMLAVMASLVGVGRERAADPSVANAIRSNPQSAVALLQDVVNSDEGKAWNASLRNVIGNWNAILAGLDAQITAAKATSVDPNQLQTAVMAAVQSQLAPYLPAFEQLSKIVEGLPSSGGHL